MRRKFGIPPTPSESTTPLMDAVQLARESVKGFWQDVKEKNFSSGSGGVTASQPQSMVNRSPKLHNRSSSEIPATEQDVKLKPRRPQ